MQPAKHSLTARQAGRQARHSVKTLAVHGKLLDKVTWTGLANLLCVGCSEECGSQSTLLLITLILQTNVIALGLIGCTNVLYYFNAS